jgi:hypothetical protein
MARVWLVLGMAYMFLQSGIAFATASYKCALQWDTVSEGQTQVVFSFKGSGSVSLHDNRDLVTIQGDRNHSRLSIVQKFETPKGRDSIAYEIQCDPWLNCQGSRVQTQSSQPPVKDLFKFDPGTQAVARIGERELFQFKPSNAGFSYQFIAYRLPDGKPKGMELTCHE